MRAVVAIMIRTLEHLVHFFHASRNVVQCLKDLETVQAIEHSAVVNACKKSGNSYYRSQVTIAFTYQED